MASSLRVNDLEARVERLESLLNDYEEILEAVVDDVAVLENEVESIDRAMEMTVEGIDENFDMLTARIDNIDDGIDPFDDDLDEDDENPCIGCEEDCPEAIHPPVSEFSGNECHNCDAEDCDVNVPVTLSRKEVDIILNLIAHDLLSNKDMYGPESITRKTLRALFKRFDAILDQ